MDTERLKNSLNNLIWAKVMAVGFILEGAILVFGCITLPLGILSIMAGLKLWQASDDLSRFKNLGDPEYAYIGIEGLSSFMRLYGWLILIPLTLITVGVIFAIFVYLARL